MPPTTEAALARVDLAVAVAVLREVLAGATPLEALRAVCGAARVDAMIAALYDELRAQEAR